MFSLIIAIVSIALVVALVAATMYHGGDTLTQGRSKADAAAIVAGAQQVSGAAVMFLSLEGTEAADVDALIAGKYLASKPTVGDLELGGVTGARLVEGVAASDDVCLQINRAAGSATPEAVLAIGDLPYACITADKTFSFKF